MRSFFYASMMYVIVIFLAIGVPSMAITAPVITGISSHSNKILKSTRQSSNESVHRDRVEGSELNIVWLMIQGSGFNAKPNKNRVIITEKDGDDKRYLPVITATNELIYVVLPHGISPGEHMVKVVNDGVSEPYKLDIKELSSLGNIGNKLDTKKPTSYVYIAKIESTSHIKSKRSFEISTVHRELRQDDIDSSISSSTAESLSLKTVKLIHPIPDYDTYVIKADFDELLKAIKSKDDVVSFTKGGYFSLVIHIVGNLNRISNFDVEAILKDDKGIPIKLDRDLKSTINVEQGEKSSDNYSALVYFQSQFPFETSSREVNIEILLTPTGKNLKSIVSNKKLSVREPSGIKLKSHDVFISSNDPISIIIDKKGNDLPVLSQIAPGKVVRLVHQYIVSDMPKGKEEEITCTFELKKESQVKGKVSDNSVRNICEQEIYLPPDLTPGNYTLKAGIKNDKTGTVEGKTFKFTVLPYKPVINMFTWIVNPIELTSRFSFEDNTKLLALNALSTVRRGELVGFISEFRPEGFPVNSDKKHIVKYSITIKDTKGTTWSFTPDGKGNEVEDVNQRFRIYKTTKIPQQLANGPLEYSFKVSIDDFETEAYNGVLLVE